jgi:hypothetical protein
VAASASQPVLPWLAQECGFPQEVMQGQADAILRFVLQA